MNSPNLDPEFIAKGLLEVGYSWAKKNEQADQLDEAFRSVMAQAELDVRANWPDGTKPPSNDVVKAHARANQDIKDYINNMVKVRGEANRARVKYDVAKTKFAAIQSHHAMLRMEMQTLKNTP